MKQSTGVVILAGGKSERMGCPKPYLDFHGKTFIEQIVETYKLAEIQNILVVMNETCILSTWKEILARLKNEVKIVVNDNSIPGRFQSLKLGLDNLDKLEYCFLQNVDNPFVNPDLLHTLYEKKIQHGYTVPMFESKGGHPILISKSIMHYIRNTEKSERTLREILSDFNRNEVVVNDPSILFNINTPDDYNQHVISNGTLR